MLKLNQKGALQYFLIFVLFLGLGVGLYLVQQRTNLLPKAYDVPPSSEQATNEVAVPPGERQECAYAPEGHYSTSVYLPQAQSFNLNSRCEDSSIEEKAVSFGGLIASEEDNNIAFGTGDSLHVADTLDSICQSRGLTGSICNLCVQKIDCKSYYVGVSVDKVAGLSCSTSRDGKKQYNVTGTARVDIFAGAPMYKSSLFTRDLYDSNPPFSYMYSVLKRCLEVSQEDVNVNITATYQGEWNDNLVPKWDDDPR